MIVESRQENRETEGVGEKKKKLSELSVEIVGRQKHIKKERKKESKMKGNGCAT